VWDRKRAEQLFDFSYRLECYTPAPKRQYGYFVLPLLHRGRLVGRMDAKMHRKASVLEVIALYLENGVKPGRTLEKGLINRHWRFCALARCAARDLGSLPEGLFIDHRQGLEIDAT
jgi:uncharacterized protein YcaQ